jgi:LmbE family N-acetylglucosaminyl deacetylase/GTP:adenosylcobinamide-phosphate guanylyltransferase
MTGGDGRAARVSCVIPACNEERTIASVIEAARQVDEISEVIVVSDGSRDTTAEIAAAAGADLVIRLPRNLGKGGAIMAGVRRAGKSVVLLLDADLQHLKPREISALIRPVLMDGCDMAVGVLAEDLVQHVLPALSGLRVVRRDALLAQPHLAATRYGIERALTTAARRMKWKVARVPFTGVVHLRKGKKHNLVEAYRGKMFFSTRAVGSALDVFPEPEMGDRYLIVAAHADDELLAAGGLLQRALAAGASVWVVFATNGDAYRLGASISGKRLRARASDYIAEGKARRREARRVMGTLGLPADRVIFLGYPDRGLMALASTWRDPGQPFISPFTRAAASPYPDSFRPGAPYTGADLLRDLEAVMLQARPTVVLTHHAGDRHSDHQALNMLVRDTIRSLAQQDRMPRPLLFTFLVHAWDFPRPLRYAPDQPLLPPKSLRDGQAWVRFDLTPEELAAKRAALREYRSQLGSPYLRMLLHSFLRQNELFAVSEP